MAELFIKGLIVHLIVDFFLQSDWIVAHKVNLTHPAAWLHSGILLAGNLLVFTPPIAIGLSVAHLLLDTRRPLAGLQRLCGQHPQGEQGRIFNILQDQAAHIILVGVAALIS